MKNIFRQAYEDSVDEKLFCKTIESETIKAETGYLR